jgi:serine/threonine protein kinase
MEAFDARGRRYSLAETPEAGGEGRIYRIGGDQSRVAKIFHSSRRTTELEAKLLVMVRRPPEDPTLAIRRHRSIAWPQDVLYSDSSRQGFVGFTMPAVDTKVFREAHTYYDTEDRLRRFGGAYTWRHLMIAAHNLSSAVSAIHQRGYRVGDLRDTNILVAPNSLITMIDCDSFQVDDSSGRRFPTRVGTGEYLPPELQSADFRLDTIDRLHSDQFALAVLIFKFLMLGTHPFQAKGTAVIDLPSTEAKIAAGVFPYAGGSKALPPDYAPPFKILPPAIRSLMNRAFYSGHSSPERRPSSGEWFEALDREGPRLKKCRRNPNHMFAGHLLTCPWCAWQARTRPDPFPRAGILGDQESAGHPETAPSLDRRYQHLKSHVLVALADGPLSSEEVDFLRGLGSELGLRKVEVSGVIRDAIRTAPPPKAHAPKATATQTITEPKESPPERKRDLSELLRLLREFEPTDKRGPSEMVAEGVVGLTLAVLALAAPVALVVAVVLGLVPALAIAGRIRESRERGSTWKAMATALPAIPQQILLAVYHAVPAAMTFGAAATIAYFSSRGLQSDPDLPIRVLTSLSVVGWLWWLLHRTKEEDRFLRGLRKSSSRLISWVLKPLRFGYRHIYAVGLAFGGVVVMVLKGFVTWWPVS